MTARRTDEKRPDREQEPLRLWGRAAGRYAGDRSAASTFHASIYLPVVDVMLGDVRNKKILDAGCGNGKYAKKLASAGATVIGIDGSPEMIRLACRDNAHPLVMYAVTDLTRPLPVRSRSMDIVVANMVLMDLPEIETCTGEFSRILRDGGMFVFSITHPAFFCSDWVGDESGPRPYKMVRDYLHQKTESLDFWGETFHYHRPLSDYFRVLERNGLTVISLEEPVPHIGADETDPRILCHLRVPSFLVAKAALRKGN
ncbi:class I SAM-dependent methyltransferase [Methanofollis formosanus]|uniref:Class I SAM-dependent methyltransferase n=1 Tax=Methanofollis formosanus TaxID=299308 RepID=A0A8G1A0P2_9EURY|nr:class I SAM-dependent methyltransferase [Methanofollis formosanus]QYZ78875.1 class I SAM-dependent methyltransferase [Methanofollis formosanus]